MGKSEMNKYIDADIRVRCRIEFADKHTVLLATLVALTTIFIKNLVFTSEIGKKNISCRKKGKHQQNTSLNWDVMNKCICDADTQSSAL